MSRNGNNVLSFVLLNYIYVAVNNIQSFVASVLQHLQIESCLRHIAFGQLWPVWVCRIFHNYLLNGTIFEKQKYLSRSV